MVSAEGAVPDTRSHKGLHPRDAEEFAPGQSAVLRAATAELSYLLGRGYAPVASLKLVGDRHQLTVRQRAAVARAACGEERAAARRAKRCELHAARGRQLWVDGFNVLTTLEVALSGGIVLGCVDGTLRDIAGVHGSYRAVEETEPALHVLASVLQQAGVSGAVMLLDRPVSNSGRLCARIDALAAQHGWPLTAQVVQDPDAVLAASTELIATADGELLDRCARWVNLARVCVERHVPSARVVELGTDSRNSVLAGGDESQN